MGTPADKDAYVRLGFGSNTSGNSGVSDDEASDDLSTSGKKHKPGERDSLLGNNENTNGCCAKFFPLGFGKNLKEILQVAWPVCLSQISQMMFAFVATIFCGRLGDVIQLDAVALANSLINITGVAVGIGLSSACDTLFSQTFGSTNKNYMGVVLQRSLIIMGLASFPCMALHINAEPFLTALGQDPTVARYTAQYLLLFLPAVPSFFITIVLTKYLQNMNILYPPMVIGIVANLLNALLHYVFVTVLEQQIWGSALAQMASFVTQALCTGAYIIISGAYKNAWDGWNKDCLLDWGPFYYLAFWGMVMTCVEWWAFEIGMFLAGILGSAELGAQTVAFQYDTIWYQVPYGIGVAASIIVGHRLGAGDKLGAITANNVCMAIIAVMCPVVSIIFGVTRNQLPLLFTDVPEVVDLAATILPIVGLYLLFDGTAAVTGGILRGCGRQLLGAMTIFTGYVVGLGIGIPLMFLTSLRLVGLWIGFASALLVESIIMLLLVQCSNWDSEVKKAQERAKIEDEADDTDTENMTSGLLNRVKSIDAPPRHLPHPPLPRRSQSLPTSNLGIRQPLIGPSKESTITKTLLCKRLVVVLAFCAILAIGVVFRLSYEVDSTELPDTNVTTSTDTINTVTSSVVTNSTIQNALFSLAL